MINNSLKFDFGSKVQIPNTSFGVPNFSFGSGFANIGNFGMSKGNNNTDWSLGALPVLSDFKSAFNKFSKADSLAGAFDGMLDFITGLIKGIGLLI